MKTKFLFRLKIALVGLSIGLFNCQANDQEDLTKDKSVEFDPVGYYVSSFGGAYRITGEAIVDSGYVEGSGDYYYRYNIVSSGSLTDLADYAAFLVAQNDESNPFNGGKYSRFDFIRDGDYVYYCQTGYAEETAEAAEALEPADFQDIDNGGCGGQFPFTELVRVKSTNPLVSFIGSYTDNYGGEFQFDWTKLTTFSEVAVIKIDPDRASVFTRNPSHAAYNPSKISRFDFARTSEGLYYCTTVYDAETLAEAEEAPLADASDPANSGCGSFAWTELSDEN